MTETSKTVRNNISPKARLLCFLIALSDPKDSLNKKYAESKSKIRLNGW